VKKLIYGLYALFFVLIAITFYMANTIYDGLVEDRYYERSKYYFETKRKEEETGFKITLDENLKVGGNDISIHIRNKDGPLTGARVTLFVGNISSTEYDRTFILKETSPGAYVSRISIPFSGRWLLRADIDHTDIRTGRKWDLRVE
jgi:hypothetical protein